MWLLHCVWELKTIQNNIHNSQKATRFILQDYEVPTAWIISCYKKFYVYGVAIKL
jgi:hypothetical protein